MTNRCESRRFLWFQWRSHQWRRLNIPEPKRYHHYGIGVHENKVYWKLSEFDDGPYFLHQVKTCDCGEIRFVRMNSTMEGNACHPFESKLMAFAHVCQIEREKRDDN